MFILCSMLTPTFDRPQTTSQEEQTTGKRGTVLLWPFLPSLSACLLLPIFNSTNYPSLSPCVLSSRRECAKFVKTTAAALLLRRRCPRLFQLRTRFDETFGPVFSFKISRAWALRSLLWMGQEQQL